jgi:hypothetical protein
MERTYGRQKITQHDGAMYALIQCRKCGECEKLIARNSSAADVLAAAYEEFSATGTTAIKCDSCGAVIVFRALSPRAWASHCECGKFNDTLRGL